jgi:hypothetical protein
MVMPSVQFTFYKTGALSTTFDCGVFGQATIVKQHTGKFKVTLPGRVTPAEKASMEEAKDFTIAWFQEQITTYTRSLANLRQQTSGAVQHARPVASVAQSHPATCFCPECKARRAALAAGIGRRKP